MTVNTIPELVKALPDGVTFGLANAVGAIPGRRPEPFRRSAMPAKNKLLQADARMRQAEFMLGRADKILAEVELRAAALKAKFDDPAGTVAACFERGVIPPATIVLDGKRR